MGDGINIGTDENMTSNIGVDWITEIGENICIQCGVDWTLDILGSGWNNITGSWNKFIKGDFQKFIVGASTTQILGAKSTLILGVKQEAVVGGIHSFTAGIKMEKAYGWNYKRSATGGNEQNPIKIEKATKQSNDIKTLKDHIKTHNGNIDKANYNFKTLERMVKTNKEDIDESKLKIKSLKEDYDKHKMKVGDFSATVSKNWKIAKSALQFLMKSNVELKNSSAKIVIKTSKVTINGTALVVKT